MVPGKLGASNELPNALMAYQLLRVGPMQQIISQRLAVTLGDKSKSGLDLEPTDFVLRKISDEINPQQMDTISRMRETLESAKAKGRDIDEGVKD